MQGPDSTARELDDDLMKMSQGNLEDEHARCEKLLASEGFSAEQNINIPDIDTHAQMISIKLALVAAGVVSHEEMDKWFLVYKITQMRRIVNNVLPEIRKARARAAIMQPGAVSGKPGLHIPGNGG